MKKWTVQRNKFGTWWIGQVVIHGSHPFTISGLRYGLEINRFRIWLAFRRKYRII